MGTIHSEHQKNDNTDPNEYEYLLLPCERKYPTLFQRKDDIWELIVEVFQNVKDETSFLSAMNAVYDNFEHKYDPLLLNDYVEELRSNHPEQLEDFNSIIQTIVKLLLRTPEVFKSHINGENRIPLLTQGKQTHLTLTREQIACLVSLQFCCCIDMQRYKNEDFPYPSFVSMYSEPMKFAPQNLAKFECILNYFRRIRDDKVDMERPLTIYRAVLHDPPIWGDSNAPLLPIIVKHEGKIENEDNTLHADFANEYLGGGVLQRGCVQEEILFAINTELLCSMILCSTMEDNEAVHFFGFERFSSYVGYGRSLGYGGNFEEPSELSKHSHIVAMDAKPWFSNPMQYTESGIEREYQKAFIAFSPVEGFEEAIDQNGNYKAVSTGNWGCGAFGGNKYLKLVVQYLAASQCKRQMVYFTFGESFMDEPLAPRFTAFSEFCTSKNMTVGDLWKALMSHRFSGNENILYILTHYMS